jgi:hypothetical protein
MSADVAARPSRLSEAMTSASISVGGRKAIVGWGRIVPDRPARGRRKSGSHGLGSLVLPSIQSLAGNLDRLERSAVFDVRPATMAGFL